MASVEHAAAFERLNQLTELAQQRRMEGESRSISSDGCIGGYDLHWLDSAEREERHRLLQSLPTFRESAAAAHRRVLKRIEAIRAQQVTAGQ